MEVERAKRRMEVYGDNLLKDIEDKSLKMVNKIYKSFRLNVLDSAFDILNTFLHKGDFKSYLVFSHSDN